MLNNQTKSLKKKPIAQYRLPSTHMVRIAIETMISNTHYFVCKKLVSQSKLVCTSPVTLSAYHSSKHAETLLWIGLGAGGGGGFW